MRGSTEFIKATGIQKQREAMEEKLKLQTAKQKMRERVNPKVRPCQFCFGLGA
jgi:hypothetical protein